MQSEATGIVGGFELVKADFESFQREFVVYAVMRDNRRFKQSYAEMAAMVAGAAEVCWFVNNDGKRVGGVITAGNHIAGLYTHPWADHMEAEVLEFLHRHVLSTGATEVNIQLTRADQKRTLEPLGYEVTLGDYCMICPVVTHLYAYPDGLVEAAPAEDLKTEMADLLWEANQGVKHYTLVGSMEKAAEEIDVFFKITAGDGDALCRKASVLLREVGGDGGSGGRLVGMCLISMFESLPLIFEVCVHPSHRRRGLASSMMERSISALASDHSLVRLFVAEGNPARLLYERLGFLAGDPSLVMKYRS